MQWIPDADSFEWIGQEGPMDCVPACVAMVCGYIGLDKDIDAIRDELETDPDMGTDFEDVRLLLGAKTIRVGSLDEAAEHILLGRPVIARIQVEPEVLGYGTPHRATHAVVIIGIGAEEVVFQDPFSMEALSTSL